MSGGTPPEAGEVLVSVLIPLWNRAHLIGDAIASVVGDAGLPREVEIVVMDDGSTDGGAEAAAAAIRSHGLEGRARVARQANAGVAAARNAAAALARGRWLACLDSDDLWMPWTAATLAALLRDRPTIDVAFLKAVNVAGRDHAPPAREPLQVAVFEGFLPAYASESRAHYLSGNNFVCRSALFGELGGFDPAWRVLEDMDMFLRLPPRTEVAVIAAPMMVAHVDSADGLTKSHAAARDGVGALRRAERRGRYAHGGGPARDRRVYVARTICFYVANGWRSGERAASYALLLRHAPYLLRHRCKLWIWRFHRQLIREFAGWAFSSGGRPR